MCGFLGFVSKSDDPKFKLPEALQLIDHRGPDHHGYDFISISNSCVGLGHTRLSIIDLTNAASQPFYSHCGNYILTYNGEIYNYKELRSELESLGCQFSTRSDTEVLLNAWIYWKESALKKLIGMFAFAILDRHKKKLILARDAFGIKPLFYAYNRQELFFSSELPALLKLRNANNQPDLQVAYDYLIHGDYDCSGSTFVDGVKQLQPSQYLELDIEKSHLSKPRTWWRPDLSNNSDLSFHEAKDKLQDLFLESVSLHLRSDVPLGAALSGGIDSSSVVCAIRHLEPELPIHTFSYIASDEEISEEKWVDAINQHVAAIEHKVKSNSRKLTNDIEEMILAQGEPFSGTSIYAQYRVFQLAKQEGIKVTLDGQGADELLAGYSGYPGERLLSLIEGGKLIKAHQFAYQWAKWPNRTYILALRALSGLIFPNFLYAFIHNLIGKKTEPAWLNTLLLKEKGVVLGKKRMARKKTNKGIRVKEALAKSLQSHGLPSLLRHGDRNAMQFSIESRVPFLTIPLAEFLLSLPEEYLISNNGATKHIFREAMRGIVPDSHLDRKDKIGFETPESQWLIDMQPKLKNWINDAPDINFLNKSEMLKELDSIIQGKRALQSQAWRWINYLKWYSLLDLGRNP